MRVVFYLFLVVCHSLTAVSSGPIRSTRLAESFPQGHRCQNPHGLPYRPYRTYVSGNHDVIPGRWIFSFKRECY